MGARRGGAEGGARSAGGGTRSYQVHATWLVGESASSATNEANFTFNICGNVVNKPAECAGHGPSMAYMVVWQDGSSTTPVCYNVGSDFNYDKPLPYSFSLHDTWEPSYGYNLRYLSTSAGGPGQVDCVDPTYTRSIELAMICDDTPMIKPGKVVQAGMRFSENSNFCTYEIYLPSTIGCPQECPIVDGKLCAGKGVCRYDTGLEQSRCFCDDGWVEKDCTAPANPLPGGAVAGAIFGGIFIGLIGVGVYWAWQVYSKRGAGASGGGDADIQGYYDAPIEE